MLTLLGSLLGFLSSALPKLFEFFQQKQDNQLKMQMLQAQIEAHKSDKEFDLRAFHETKDFEEQKLLIMHDMSMKDSKLSSSVRPLITYMFFGLFAAVKVSLIVNAYKSSDFNTAIQLAWDEETQAIFAAIISFWFGSRAMEKKKK